MDESNPLVDGSSDSDPPEPLDQRESFLPDENPGGTFPGARMCDSCRPCPGKPRDVAVTNLDTVSRERFPAGLSPAIRIGYSRRFRDETSENLRERKTGKTRKKVPHKFSHGNHAFIFKICPDAAGATKTRRKKEIRFRNKNGKISRKISRKSDRYNPDTDPPPRPVRLAYRVLFRRQEFRTSPCPLSSDETHVQPT